MLKEFKEFIMKGNLVEIAVGLVLALAFKAVIDSLSPTCITPIIAADRWAAGLHSASRSTSATG